MNGRFLGIKKSFILKAFAMLAFLSFVAYIFISIFWVKNPTLWFFGFCLFLGGFELVKSMLFKFDSSFYLGSLLVSIGILGFVFHHTDTASYAPFYIAIAFVIASVATFFFCGQKFHLIVAFSIVFVSLYFFLFSKNLISTPILIAFVVPFLVLLILEILMICFHKK